MITTKKVRLLVSWAFVLLIISWCGQQIDTYQDLTWDTEIIDKVNTLVEGIWQDGDTGDIYDSQVEEESINTGSLAPSQSIWMANPASTNCAAKWWKLEIKDGTWWQYGICKFENWKECEERAFFRWECSN